MKHRPNQVILVEESLTKLHEKLSGRKATIHPMIISNRAKIVVKRVLSTL